MKVELPGAPGTDPAVQREGTIPVALLRSLAGLGVTYIVVHTELYPPGEWPQVGARLELWDDWLRLEHTAGTGRVYSLHAPVASRSPD